MLHIMFEFFLDWGEMFNLSTLKLAIKVVAQDQSSSI
jgi:hypothetical protein